MDCNICVGMTTGCVLNGLNGGFVGETEKIGRIRGNQRIPDYRLKYKTELCRNWENGNCAYGGSCAFAHGLGELRRKTDKTLFSKENQTETPLIVTENREIQREAHPNVEIGGKQAVRRLAIFIDLESRCQA